VARVIVKIGTSSLTGELGQVDEAMVAELCQQVNRILCGRIAEDRFISFFYCVIDAELGTLTFANAGHYAPVLIREDGTAERLASGGPVLGVFPEATYGQDRIAMRSGDRLVLFTDGITEARREDDEEFGEDRLVSVAREHRACSAPALQARVTAAVSAFTGGCFQDDATLIVLAAD